MDPDAEHALWHQIEIEQQYRDEIETWLTEYDNAIEGRKMDVSGFLTSNGALLKKEDIGNSRPKVKIAGVDVTEFDGDKKLVLRFEGKEKGMALNKTNTLIMAEAFGSETDHWVGQTVELWVDPYVTFGGKVVGGLKLTPMQNQAPPPAPPPQTNAADPNDDIPF